MSIEQDNIEILKDRISELQMAQVDTNNYIAQLHNHMSQQQNISFYPETDMENFYGSQMWQSYHSFGDRVDVSVYIRQSDGSYTIATNPTVRITHGMVEVSHPLCCDGYVVMRNVNAQPAPYPFAISQPFNHTFPMINLLEPELTIEIDEDDVDTNISTDVQSDDIYADYNRAMGIIK